MQDAVQVRESVHIPVLLHEVVAALTEQEARSTEHGEEQKKLTIAPSSMLHEQNVLWFLDGTLGGAGHARAIAEAFKGTLNVIGLDRDPQAIERAKTMLAGKAERVILECESFRNLDKVLGKNGIAGVDMILLDLGISSDELESSGRGFSFLKDEPLLMTMGDPASHPFTAKTIVNEWDEADIANVIFAYGEERYARRIAGAIVRYREKKPIETSAELGELIKLAVPPMYRRSKIHPATKTFQALRIAVNDELAALKEGVAKGYERLNADGRMAVISFHSLEDRIVKDFFRKQAQNGAHLITKKPIRPTDKEIEINPRSRSAKLRVIQKGSL